MLKKYLLINYFKKFFIKKKKKELIFLTTFSIFHKSEIKTFLK